MMFKVGDLVKLNGGFSQRRHPPMGTYGVVINIRDWKDPDHGKLGQLVKVEWAHPRNYDDQLYMDHSLKLEASAEI